MCAHPTRYHVGVRCFRSLTVREQLTSGPSASVRLPTKLETGQSRSHGLASLDPKQFWNTCALSSELLRQLSMWQQDSNQYSCEANWVIGQAHILGLLVLPKCVGSLLCVLWMRYQDYPLRQVPLVHLARGRNFALYKQRGFPELFSHPRPKFESRSFFPCFFFFSPPFPVCYCMWFEMWYETRFSPRVCYCMWFIMWYWFDTQCAYVL